MQKNSKLLPREIIFSKTSLYGKEKYRLYKILRGWCSIILFIFLHINIKYINKTVYTDSLLVNNIKLAL